MPTAAQVTFSQKRTLPIYPNTGRQIAVPLAPGIYNAGQVVGQITSANVNDVQTITVAACTHSTLTLYNLPGGLSYAAAQDITPAALTTALNALLGANSVVVTGTYAAGSGGTYIFTFSGGNYSGQPIGVIVVSATFVGGSSPTAVNVHTTTGVGPLGAYGTYASGNSDGTQTAIGILEYPCVVVGNQIYLGSQASSEFGQAQLTAPVWYRGDFDTADLAGLDSTAVTSLGAHYITGSGATGVLHIP